MAQAAINRQLVVFDFDWSLVDQDSDRWIFEVLAPHLRRKMKTVKASVQWTDLVAQSLRDIHDEGKTKSDIEGALESLPFHPAMIRAVKKLKARSSPSTIFFLSFELQFCLYYDHPEGLQDLFEEIVTNPAEWDPSGLLNLRRRVDPNGTQHQCKVGCSPNMCKGEELEAFLKRHGPEFDRVIYVGDGTNDFCPILRFRKQDLCLCRSYRGLARRIASEGEACGLQCQVKYWGGAWEVEEIFDQL